MSDENDIKIEVPLPEPEPAPIVVVNPPAENNTGTLLEINDKLNNLQNDLDRRFSDVHERFNTWQPAIPIQLPEPEPEPEVLTEPEPIEVAEIVIPPVSETPPEPAKHPRHKSRLLGKLFKS